MLMSGDKAPEPSTIKSFHRRRSIAEPIRNAIADTRVKNESRKTGSINLFPQARIRYHAARRTPRPFSPAKLKPSPRGCGCVIHPVTTTVAGVGAALQAAKVLAFYATIAIAIWIDRSWIRGLTCFVQY
ncbi:hypothetical protein F66182_5190 [Fusarium sp. NRRL 66182]|nr:hypothetical protein F66182_5190 [Fusarium sp. NRRL 66182]